MPIEGELKSLNIASILQLIAQERLTGVLRIKKKADIVDIGFIEGFITGAFYERGEKTERLERYLVKSGIIKKNLFDMIEEIHLETKRPIMNIIIEDKYLTMEEIEKIIKFKIQEVLDEVFTWNEGEFKFEEGSILYPKSMIKIRLDTTSVVLESARRIDEWPRIIQKIPSGDLVFKKVQRPELKLAIPEDQMRVLSLLDGYRSVDALTEISGLGKFHTYSALYHLLTTGQIELCYAKPKLRHAKPQKEISLKFLKVPAAIIVFLGILLVEVYLGNHFGIKFKFTPEITMGISRKNYEDYQKIFFYRHNRLPSIEEIKDIFGE